MAACYGATLANASTGCVRPLVAAAAQPERGTQELADTQPTAGAGLTGGLLVEKLADLCCGLLWCLFHIGAGLAGEVVLVRDKQVSILV